MNKKLTATNRPYILLTLAIVFILSWNVQAQNKVKEQPINCEYIKLILDVLDVQTRNKLVITKSGFPPYTVFVISPGNRKDSNLKVAEKLIKSLTRRLHADESEQSRNIVIEAKPRKGYGHLQIYHMNEVQDYPFADNVLECP